MQGKAFYIQASALCLNEPLIHSDFSVKVLFIDLFLFASSGVNSSCTDQRLRSYAETSMENALSDYILVSLGHSLNGLVRV